MPDMNRRGFMFSLLALLSAANSRVFASGILDNDLDRESYLSNRIMNLINERMSAEYIGKNYLLKNPAERNRRYLLNALVLDNDSIVLSEALTADMLKQKIRQKHLSDFANKQTVLLDGWVLSKTECRMSALAYMQSIA